jgi:hypothetical protein
MKYNFLKIALAAGFVVVPVAKKIFLMCHRKANSQRSLLSATLKLRKSGWRRLQHPLFWRLWSYHGWIFMANIQ